MERPPRSLPNRLPRSRIEHHQFGCAILIMRQEQLVSENHRRRADAVLADEFPELLLPQGVALEVIGMNPNLFAIPEHRKDTLSVRRRRGSSQGVKLMGMSRRPRDRQRPPRLAVPVI